MKQMTVKIVLVGVLLAVVVFSQGCASIISKSSYPVKITSSPSGAGITVYNKKGEQVHRGTTPATVNLKAGAGYFSGQNYTVEFRKDGYPVRKAQIRRGVDGWYIGGNFLFGGLIGWLIVDPLTGAMWTLKDLHIDLQNPPRTELEDSGSLRVVLLDQVPKDLHSAMVRIN